MYPEVTTNMMGQVSYQVSPRGRKPAVSSEESDANRSPGLKDVLIEPEGVYRPFEPTQE